MTVFLKKLPMCGIFFLLLGVAGCKTTGQGDYHADHDSPARPAVDQPAPDFTLKTIEGEPAKLSELADDGPVVLLILRGYIGKQCPICNRQVGQYLMQAQAFADRGAKVVMIYPGPAEGLGEHAEDFVSGKGLPEHFVFLLDPDFTFTDQYDLRWAGVNKTAYPATYVINRGDRVVKHAHVSNNAGNRTTPDEILKVLDGA